MPCRKLPAWGEGRLSFSILALVLLATPACSRKTPDLLFALPSPGSDLSAPEPALCRRDEQGRLVVVVSNQGKKATIATTTQISFSSLAPVVLPTRPVAPGETIHLVVTIPDRCFSPSCHYIVDLDSRHEVLETDEVNNRLVGHCETP